MFHVTPSPTTPASTAAGDALFSCQTCGKLYGTDSALRRHERRQHSDSVKQNEDVSGRKSDGSQRAHRYVCEACGLRFMYRSALQTHSATHTETRAFSCPDCPARFRTYATLYSHRRTHTPDKPFPCDICSKRFKTTENLQRHRQRHSGEKPFQCDRCPSCFPDKGGLSKHQRTVHSSVPGFQCPECAKTCSRADNLRVHMKSHNNPDLLKLSRDELMIKEDLSIGAETSIVSITAINPSSTTNPSHNPSHNPSNISNPSHTATPSLNPSHPHSNPSTTNMIQVLLPSEMDEPAPSEESPGQPIQQQYVLHPASTQPGSMIALQSLYVLDPNTQTLSTMDSFPQQHVPQ
jgi:DNA-directed RNA polymerase subunit M/transcription elongation factor TFIIS